jgi:hypothetical protein
LKARTRFKGFGNEKDFDAAWHDFVGVGQHFERADKIQLFDLGEDDYTDSDHADPLPESKIWLAGRIVRYSR